MFPNHYPFPPDEALPPEKVRITELKVEPWEDGRRMRVQVEVTPFEKRPNLTAVITGLDGEEITSTSIVEVMDLKMVFTMHLRVPEVADKYRLTASISYEEEGVVAEQTITFVPTAGRGEDS